MAEVTGPPQCFCDDSNTFPALKDDFHDDLAREVGPGTGTTGTGGPSSIFFVFLCKNHVKSMDPVISICVSLSYMSQFDIPHARTAAQPTGRCVRAYVHAWFPTHLTSASATQGLPR